MTTRAPVTGTSDLTISLPYCLCRQGKSKCVSLDLPDWCVWPVCHVTDPQCSSCALWHAAVSKADQFLSAETFKSAAMNPHSQSVRLAQTCCSCSFVWCDPETWWRTTRFLKPAGGNARRGRAEGFWGIFKVFLKHFLIPAAKSQQNQMKGAEKQLQVLVELRCLLQNAET